MAVAPSGRWPSAAATTEFGTTHCAELRRRRRAGRRPSCTGGCERTVAADQHVDLRDRCSWPDRAPCVWNGSTLWQPRGSGPAATLVFALTWLYFVAIAQLSTTAAAGGRAERRRQAAAQARVDGEVDAVPVAVRSGPKSVSHVR